ncbi:MAG TPA: NAD(P)/FAD-dependent oxidoreductase [Steroidobacteraceae bacterium]|nr:NAD(P)/FAD-dependent oxidoreductase [Steroidobacteraceae bacterium]
MAGSSSNSFDAIVIGAGHNGMIAAAYLARAGKKVVVLERRELVGGSTVTEEIFPGYRFSEFSYVVSLLRPEIIRDLELPKHGLRILPLPSTVTPMENGDYLAGWDDHDLTRREIYRHSPLDAEAYDEYSRVMARAAKAIKPIIGLVPPDPSSMSWRDLRGLLKLGRYGASLGERDLQRISKLATQSSADLLEEWFELDPLKGTKAASGIIGTYLGPRSPGTAYVLLHHYMGEIDGAFRAWGFPKDGTGGVAEPIAAAARALGVDIRTGAPVRQVIVRGGRAAGVALENGDELAAKVVLSATDPKRSFLEFVDSRHFPDEFTAAIRNFRVRGSSGKVNIALSELPQFTCLPGEGPLHRGAISISPSIDYVERAYDDAKYGQFSRRPYMDIIIPSMIDRDMAPPGHHVMSCFVQYAPYDIEGGWDDAKREAFGEAVISTIERYAPDIRRAIVGKQVITPKDIERIAGITGGNIFHGELLLHQLFFLRPAPGWADFRTPLPGYYYGAAGAHPGGGIMGAAGKMAAEEALKDWR